MFFRLKLRFLRLFLRLLGYHSYQARRAEEKMLVFRNRWHIYRDEGYITEQQHPEKIFQDKHDPHSDLFFVVYGSKIIGSCRLVHDSKLGFPLELYANINMKNVLRDNMVEVSRLVIEKSHRGRAQKRYASFMLLSEIYLFARKNDIEYFIGTMNKKLSDSLAHFGAEMKKLDELPLQDKHREAREEIKGYYERVKEVYPYIVTIRSIGTKAKT
ncbi:hypothetical protein A3J56_00350 [Candidatus Giovannonibacteria bacterium RIFCSPHIGHO2_02_FULL_46_20]|uniref:N-acyl amino acid synthase FeeM catalytic core domain-containing protein n=1 Tax=Candidatus Giovannonibacteria bacterium RIFCSPHIGHO2_02_FULL_46_20 TaxID=1798338 RepID=A0A1F5WE82_9BACT|nr:MAG: hypothetical protein A3J56_00350 [Candidatus Giovannonibacteria bacterium RIFCSPHIGHO2_02_FULL_46_20]